MEPTTIQAYQNVRAEAIYDSSKKEPLGRGYSRNYSFPNEVNQEGFRFGLSATGDSEPAATVVFPPDAPSLNTAPEHLAQYKKSHGAYEPGEQKKRDYTWDKIKGGIDPGTFAFGGTAEIDYKNGVAKALNTELEYDSKAKPTEFMPKSVAEFRSVRADELGKVRNLGLGDHRLSSQHSYGMPSKRFNDWGAKECLTGNYTEDEQQPDPDLGKSLRRGCAPEAVLSSDRVFGVPCIRQDIRPPKLPVPDFPYCNDLFLDIFSRLTSPIDMRTVVCAVGGRLQKLRQRARRQSAAVPAVLCRTRRVRGGLSRHAPQGRAGRHCGVVGRVRAGGVRAALRPRNIPRRHTPRRPPLSRRHPPGHVRRYPQVVSRAAPWAVRGARFGFSSLLRMDAGILLRCTRVCALRTRTSTLGR